MSASTPPVSFLRRARPWLISAGVLLALLLLVQQLAAPAKPEGSDKGPRAAADADFLVSASPVERTDLPLHYSALGTVTAFNTVTVRSRVDGELVKVLFEEGQVVKPGELLAVIDPRSYRAALDQAEGTLQQNQAQLRNAEIDLQRYRGLFAEDSIARQTLDTQEALVNQYRGTLKANQASVDEARLNLQFCEIRAPIAGRLGLRQVDAGNLVSAADTGGLVVITQVQPINVVFSLTEAQLPLVRQQLASGQPLPVEALDRNQQQVLASGVLATLDNQIDVATGTVKLKARFDNRDERLFPNQFVNVRLLAETLPQVLVIPANAVQRGSQGSFVYVLDADNRVSLRTITLGVSDEDRLQVLSGLQAGERVVTEGVDRLRDGMQVKVAGSPANPADKPAAVAPAGAGA